MFRQAFTVFVLQQLPWRQPESELFICWGKIVLFWVAAVAGCEYMISTYAFIR